MPLSSNRTMSPVSGVPSAKVNVLARAARSCPQSQIPKIVERILRTKIF
jgi:hypothetical protein